MVVQEPAEELNQQERIALDPVRLLQEFGVRFGSEHVGVSYFTRMTRIYTSNRPPQYNCQGTRTCYPLTATFDLWH